jgi:hypothetical protein
MSRPTSQNISWQQGNGWKCLTSQTYLLYKFTDLPSSVSKMARIRKSGLLILFFNIHLFFESVKSQISASVSIYYDPTFKAQRACATGCYLCYGVWQPSECLALDIGCGEHNVLNGCFCRTDLQPTAYSILSKCVDSACANTVDVQSALSIYTGYCATMASTVVMPSITSSAGIAIASGTVEVVSVVTVTSTPIETTIIYKSSASGQSYCCLFVSLVSLCQSSSKFQLVIKAYTFAGNNITSSIVSTSLSVRTSTTDNYVSSTTVSYSTAPSGLSGPSGLSVSDRIALGVGLSIPLLAIVVSILICRYQMRERSKIDV